MAETFGNTWFIKKPNGKISSSQDLINDDGITVFATLSA